MGRTLAEKIWDAHLVRSAEGEPDLLYIDLHLVHEVTSPQAFDGLRMADRTVRRPDLTIATEDHNVPTTGITGPGAAAGRPVQPGHRPGVTDPGRDAAQELRRVRHPAASRWGTPGQGIVHVIGPQLGLTQPGMTIVCGDSHTSTHGAIGALAFGIGTSEVEHVLATQTLPQIRPKTMAVTVDGQLPYGVTAKDLILAIIAKIGTGGGAGLHRRVPRRGRAQPVHGGPADRLQHVDRGGRAGRTGGAGRDHLRLPAGQAARAAGRRVGGGAGVLALAAHRRRRDLRPRGHAGRHPAHAVRDLGDQPGAGRPAHVVGAGPGGHGRPGRARRRRAGAAVHGSDPGHRAHRHRGGHGLRRLVHQRPDRGPAGGGRGAARPQGQ